MIAPQTYGKILKITLFGGSHEQVVGIEAEGLPKGFRFDKEKLYAFLLRRAPGRGPLASGRREEDKPVFLSGVEGESTLGGQKFRAIIENKDARSSDYDALASVPRPSHADYPARMRYGKEIDLRGGGIFSGRMTAPLCVVGGICLQWLESMGIRIMTRISSVGKIDDPTSFDGTVVPAPDFPVLDPHAREQMKTLIQEAAENGDSVGGIVECIALGVPAGVGEVTFGNLESRISSLMYAIPGVKGVEFGDGFSSCRRTGSENNDAYCFEGNAVVTKTNHAGGILGGITTGMPVVMRVGFKPTPSIARPQESVNLATGENATLTVPGRHDPCIVPRAVPVVEAALAIALSDAILEKNQSL